VCSKLTSSDFSCAPCRFPFPTEAMIITPPAKFLRLAVAGWHPGPLRVNHPEEHRAVVLSMGMTNWLVSETPARIAQLELIPTVTGFV